MKNILLTSLFSIFAACAAFAGNTTMIANYPASSGSYNKIMLENLQSTPSCSSTINGLLFVSNTSGNLELCANNQATSVPYPEVCFNRFSNSSSAFSSGNNCPTGYTQATVNGANMVDSFITANNYTVYSTVCCSSSVIVPAS